MSRASLRIPAMLPLLLLVLPGLVPGAGAQGGAPLAQRYDDVVFAALDAAFRVAYDDEGGLWYTTEGGLVHVDVATGVREVFTAVEGLPSSYAMGLAIRGSHVYVATDGGLGVVDRANGTVRALTSLDAPLPARTVSEVAVDGDDVWVGTRIGGVARWNLTTDAWTEFNTSLRPAPPFPVRRIVPQPSAVWIATEGDGLWRLDRATGAWRNLTTADGLASMTVLSVLEHGEETWIGTAAGLQRWNASSGQWRTLGAADGLPHARVLDLDLIPNAEDTLDLWASTPRGLWQYDLQHGANRTHGSAFGLRGTFVLDHAWNATHGWAVATERGVSHSLAGAWRYHATGAGNGPFTTRVTAVDSGEGGPYVWFGTDQGIAAYRRPTLDAPGVWYNLGPSQHYPGSVVNFVDTDGNTTWLATNNGTYGYDRAQNRWVSRVVEGARNLVYGVEAERGRLWIAFLGEGLLMQDLATGATRTWNYDTPISIPDINLLDVRVRGDDVWVGSARGLIRLDRLTGSVTGFWTQDDGIPGGTVYRVLPDGENVWLGTKSGALVRFDPRAGRVAQAWNETHGLPGAEVRGLHREGDRLWAGTMGGLVRLDVRTGEARLHNQSNSGLVQDYVGGVTSADGVLYAATYSGVARMDLATGEFLPMRDGPGVLRGTPPAQAVPDAARVSTLSVRIDAPREGAAVTGNVTLRGTAFRFGGSVDRVEVKVGDQPWRPARGTLEWTYEWDSATATPDRPVSILARAVAGAETSREAEVVLTPVARPVVPLAVEDLSATEAFAGKPFTFHVRLQGDPPLAATAWYKTNPHAPSWTRLELERQGATYAGTIPAREVREGEIRYYVEGRSGPLAATSPEDPREPRRVPVAPAPRLAVSVKGPAAWQAYAGTSTTIPLVVTNEGTEEASFLVKASGLRAPWLRLPDGPVVLPPGANATFPAVLSVPERAFRDSTSLTFEAQDPDGLAEPATLVLPLQVFPKPGAGAAAPTPDEGDEDGAKGLPLPAPLLAPALAALLALALRRRRA